MRIDDLFSIRKIAAYSITLLAFTLLSISAAAQASNASVTGTYTFVFGEPQLEYMQINMFGQQVGFCPNGMQLPYGYSCNFNGMGQNVIAGTLVADGNGNIISGSSYNETADPNGYQCNNNPAPVCPYPVPSGNTWSSGTAYVVGDTVDYTANGKTLTYQAVKKNSNVAPTGTNVCTAKTGKNPPACYWDELYASANGKTGGSGSLTGTYSINSDGSGTLQVTPSGNNGSVTFAIVVPAASGVGQEFTLVGLPQLGDENRGSGTAIRIK